MQKLWRRIAILSHSSESLSDFIVERTPRLSTEVACGVDITLPSQQLRAVHRRRLTVTAASDRFSSATWQGSKPWKFEPDAPYMDLPDVRRFVAHWVKIYNSESLSSPAFESRDAAARAHMKARPRAAVAPQNLLAKGITA